MIKKKKKLLFAFIVLIIAVLLFSVIWVITVYLSWPTQNQAVQQAAYQDALNNLNITGGTVSITTWSGDIITWALNDTLVGTWN